MCDIYYLSSMVISQKVIYEPPIRSYMEHTRIHLIFLSKIFRKMFFFFCVILSQKVPGVASREEYIYLLRPSGTTPLSGRYISTSTVEKNLFSKL